jgi:hypothetical protein
MGYRGRPNPISNAPPPPPWWKRRVAWIPGVLSAALAALVGAWFVWLAGPSPAPSSADSLPASSSASSSGSAVSSSGNLPTPSGSPVRIAVENVGVINQSYILPKPVALTAQQLNTLNGEADSNNRSYLNWLAVQHASFYNALDFLLVVQGNRHQAVRIVDMVPSEHCTSPLHGTLILDLNAGAVINTRLFFQLDQPRTPASYIDPNTNQTVPDYFSRYGVTLNYGEQFSFGVFAQAVQSSTCSVVFVMTVLVGNETVRETVSDQGRPFRVTGGEVGTEPGSLSSYGDVYISGGNFGSSLNNAFLVRVNPKIYIPTCDPTSCRSSVIY